jgi:molecular chaperone DnaJ
MSKDLYGLLEIGKTATQEDIKKAYKRLAMKYHPDKHSGEAKIENESKFKEISEAYGVLGDVEKRQNFDKFGIMDDSNPQAGFNPHDMFSEFFFNMGGGGAQHFNMFQQQQAPPKHDVIEIAVSLTDIFNGSSKKVQYDILDKCDVCSGHGVKDPTSDVINCLACGGAGHFNQQLGPIAIKQMCPSCGGKGRTIKPGRQCNGCKGAKVVYYSRSFDIRIPQGVPNRHIHRLEKKGSFDVNTGTYNDIALIFVHDISKEYRLEYPSHNVYTSLDINIDELLCGFSKTIKIYGKDLTICSQKYFNPTTDLCVKGYGIPMFKKKEHGDLFLKVNIVYPDEDDAKLKKYHSVFTSMYKKPELVVPKDALDVATLC